MRASCQPSVPYTSMCVFTSLTSHQHRSSAFLVVDCSPVHFAFPLCVSLPVTFTIHSLYPLAAETERGERTAAACCSRCDCTYWLLQGISRGSCLDKQNTICTRLLCVREKRCALDVCLSFSKSPAHVSGLLPLAHTHWLLRLRLCSKERGKNLSLPSCGSCAHSFSRPVIGNCRSERKESAERENRGVQKPPVPVPCLPSDYEYSVSLCSRAGRQTRAHSSLFLSRLIT